MEVANRWVNTLDGGIGSYHWATGCFPVSRRVLMRRYNGHVPS
jgi:hypothetical protein